MLRPDDILSLLTPALPTSSSLTREDFESEINYQISKRLKKQRNLRRLPASETNPHPYDTGEKNGRSRTSIKPSKIAITQT